MPSLARPAVARALTDAGEDEEDHEGVEHRHDGQRQGREDLAKGTSWLTAGDVRERVGWRPGIGKECDSEVGTDEGKSGRRREGEEGGRARGRREGREGGGGKGKEREGVTSEKKGA